jgi:hypothetical protein
VGTPAASPTKVKAASPRHSPPKATKATRKLGLAERRKRKKPVSLSLGATPLRPALLDFADTAVGKADDTHTDATYDALFTQAAAAAAAGRDPGMDDAAWDQLLGQK